MKKWNLPSMLFNDDSEFEYKFEIEYDGNQVTLFLILLLFLMT